MPEALGQLAPPPPAQLQVAPVTAAGRVSSTSTPVAVLGPELATTISYWMALPGTTGEVLVVLVIDRSPCGSRVSSSVALLAVMPGSLTPAGALTVAVFDSVPVAAGSTSQVARKVTDWPASRSTVVEMSPTPLAASQVPVPPQLQVQPESSAGKVSATGAFETPKGPALLTAML